VEHDLLWKNVLEARYGGVGRSILSLPRGNKFSLWWKDLVEIGKTNGADGDWTQLVFSKKLGCGGSTRFWLDRWVGMTPLCDTFPRLFKVSLQSESLIKDMGEWINETWQWKLDWRRRFFIREEESVKHLMEIIKLAPITKEEDSWSYIDGGMFTVRHMYLFLYKKFFPPSTLVVNLIGVLSRIWESWAPLKVIVFSWQAILGRLPTRQNLVRRRIINDGLDAACVLCGGGRESENHIFSSCATAWLVWSKVHRWFGLTSVLPDSISSLLQSFLGCYRRRKNGFKGALLVWHAVLWALWRARNERIFSGKIVTPSEIFDRIQYTSWKWLIAKKINPSCLFYEWCVNPLDCLAR
jgi:hypothetical protein